MCCARSNSSLKSKGFAADLRRRRCKLYPAALRSLEPPIRIAQDRLSRIIDSAPRTPPVQHDFGCSNQMIQPKDAQDQQNQEWNRNQQRIPAGDEDVLIQSLPPSDGSRRMRGSSCGHTVYRRRIGDAFITEVTKGREQGIGNRE